MVYVAVAEIMLERAGVDAIVGQFVTRAVPKHVRVSFEAEPRFGAGPLHEPCESGGREGAATLCHENELGVRIFSPQPPKRAQFVARYWVRARCAAFGTPYRESRLVEVD